MYLSIDLVLEKKVKANQDQAHHMNEINRWKSKVREMEKDNSQLMEILASRELSLQKLVKEKEYIYNEMVTMRRLHMHLNDSLEDKKNETIINEDHATKASGFSENGKIIPHYAEKLRRNSDIKLSSTNERRLSQIKLKLKQPQNTSKKAGLTLPSLTTPSNQKNTGSDTGNATQERLEGHAAVPKDQLEMAKIQLEYNAYVSNENKT
jgi:vacuolar-type H+-ATPase subunit I/STV1